MPYPSQATASQSAHFERKQHERVKPSLKYLLVGAAALLLVFVGYRIINAAKPPAPKKLATPLVRIAQPIRQDISYTLEYDGDVVPIVQANVFSRVAGMLENVYTDMGHTVRAGQLIALIDTAPAHQAELQTSAIFYNARAAEERTRALVNKNLAAQQDLDNAVAARKSAEAALDAAKIQVDFSKITAPFAGYITKRWLDPGSVVSSNPIIGNSNAIIFTMMDIDTVRVDINVLDQDVAKVPDAKEAIVTLSTLPGRTFSAFVATSSQAINPATRAMTVEVLIPNHDRAIKPGSFAHVQLRIGEHPQALTVPPEAVLRDSTGSFVLIAQDTVAKRRAVTTGVIQNGRLEILSGLDGSEQVIIVGQTFAKPNGKIHIVADASPVGKSPNDTTLN